MRVLFAGTPAVALPSLEALRAAGHEIVAVLTRPDAPLGRKRVLTPSPVAARAQELGLPVIKTDKIDSDAAAAIFAAAPEVAAIVAYGALIPPSALGIPAHGWINLHFSLLPAWRGAAPVQHAVINGDEITGASTFLLEKGLDTGPVFGTMTERIQTTDTSALLLERLSHSGAVLLAQTIDGIGAGMLSGIPQQGEITLAPKLSLEDGHVNWGAPALAINRRIRGVTTEPGAWTMLSGQRFKLGAVLPRPDITALAPGHVMVSGKDVLVGTGSHAVELVDVQPSGKKLMKATDWARGLANKEDVVFE
ncbi:methionyl-tRNA formyltransferase [Arthrobacter psychrochitiniphilus]|uniref:Methionyl-tRNA formyltransferase n=1 Tax=Arthrobacter psychrochitiniphilus TaxID=291045 RepID=A0A2V3DRY7_9MICC|nr:methionyl-tRNA formyltransferase [Arthrobacter psychrochitiniphilus]NYG17152.1 methionyl-tRNA formyltransferase [Arthrobacter psychrochitiniphilus]PXA65546.1 methionyl-tRNA formyltransferase [Arthrobacter psychrochitiniphilus]